MFFFLKMAVNFITKKKIIFVFIFFPTCNTSKMNDTSKITGLKIAYKSLIMLYYLQILDSIFLSTCFLSIRIFFWNWLIVGLIDLSLCTLVFEWMLPKWSTNNTFFPLRKAQINDQLKVKKSICYFTNFPIYSFTSIEYKQSIQQQFSKSVKLDAIYTKSVLVACL